jgi:hypothetical protein
MVHVVVFVLVPPPTIESMEKPILGLEGTATIGVGARGIIVCLCALVRFCPLSFASVTEQNKRHFLKLFLTTLKQSCYNPLTAYLHLLRSFRCLLNFFTEDN